MSFGTTGRNLPVIRSGHTKHFDFLLFRNFAVFESKTPQLHSGFFNIFNLVQFAAPTGAQGGVNFGTINAQRIDPRNIQFALRLIFQQPQC